MSANQPRPTPNDTIDVQTLVILDLVKRRRFGILKYGTALQANNGRDSLRDAYEEALDLPCYLRQMIAERDGITVEEVDRQTLTGLRVAMEIDKARDEIAALLHTLLLGVWDAFRVSGFDLPQTYDIQDVQQLLRDLGFKLKDFGRSKEELDMLRQKADGEVWIWQGDGLDHLESLTCPVMIRPEELLKFYTKWLEFYTKWLEPAVPGAPVPMILFCPRCGFQHVDEPEPQCDFIATLEGNKRCVKAKGHDISGKDNDAIVHSIQERHSRWTNPPHKSHLCANCGLKWRPADVETVGVEFTETRGERDTWEHSALGPPQKMLEIGVEGDKFHPHDWNSDCARAGCVPMPPGWKSPYDKREVAPGHDQRPS